MKNLALIIIPFVILSTTLAQENSPLPESKKPTLNGHSFPSLGNYSTSFITTSLEANLGFGSTSTITVPGITIGDNEIFTFKGQIMFFNMNVRYQQRFTPWLAMYVSMGMGGRIGTSMSTILVDGVNTLNGGSIGWRIRLLKTQKFNLTTTVRVINFTGSFINISDYVTDLINNVPNPSVYNQVPSMAIGAGLMGAYAFNPTYGIQFHGEYTFGESFERRKNRGYVSVGLLGDVDFYPEKNVPIDLALGYSLSSAPEIVMSDGGISHLFSAKMGYTGSDDFELGLQYTYFNSNIKSVDNKPFISKILLFMKFYF